MCLLSRDSFRRGVLSVLATGSSTSASLRAEDPFDDEPVDATRDRGEADGAPE
jgi:hypothetical protein